MDASPPSRFPLVLLVDDQEPVRVALRALLEAVGYNVIAAASGAEAITLCVGNPIDLTVCDIRLQDMSGLELLHRIDALLPGVPAVLISGYSDRLPPLGPNRRFLDKPLVLDDLTEAIESLLSGHANPSPS